MASERKINKHIIELCEQINEYCQEFQKEEYPERREDIRRFILRDAGKLLSMNIKADKKEEKVENIIAQMKKDLLEMLKEDERFRTFQKDIVENLDQLKSHVNNISDINKVGDIQNIQAEALNILNETKQEEVIEQNRIRLAKSIKEFVRAIKRQT